MTYNVFGGTLNPTLLQKATSLQLALQFCAIGVSVMFFNNKMTGV